MSNINIYIADPLSRKDIREMAYCIRKKFNLENEIYFPIVELMEMLSNSGVFNLEICSKEEMGTKFGETIPYENTIKIREDIYEKACEGDGFSRATLAHEFFHWLSHSEKNVSLCRKAEDLKNRKAYEDPEWQANCFAGELLVYKPLTKNMCSMVVIEKCKVSFAMAEYQLNQYREEED